MILTHKEVRSRNPQIDSRLALEKALFVSSLRRPSIIFTYMRQEWPGIICQSISLT